MKKYVYWGSTVLFALMMAGSGTMYFVSENMASKFAQLGFPDYFRIELGIAKLLGAVALVTPLPRSVLSRSVKEWTYAGFTISVVSAVIAHTASGDPTSALILPVVAFVLVATSYTMYHQYYRMEASTEETTTAPATS
ncbi:DoxX family protein [Salinibacter grassmerensis]|uniref:DoxX family protein n=1 Tax=Salinibacter grassmerensis TaxID=3040353 RepID=UPI0021E99DA7|nr:DoxX family protein [Salinibacter grassmerensis]